MFRTNEQFYVLYSTSGSGRYVVNEKNISSNLSSAKPFYSKEDAQLFRKTNNYTSYNIQYVSASYLERNAEI